MPKPKTIEDHINLAINTWGYKEMSSFFSDILPLFKLFDVDEQDDWLRNEAGEEDFNNVRLIRSMYLISRIAEFHVGPLLNFKTKFPRLYLKLEEAVRKIEEEEKIKPPTPQTPEQLDFFSQGGCQKT